MHKEIKKQMILLFLLSIIIYACEEINDESFIDEKQSIVDEMQKWYKVNKDNPSEVHFLEEAPVLTIKPDWEHSMISRNNEYLIVETSILADKYFGIIDPQCEQKFNETKDKRYLDSRSILVMRKKLETNQIDGFIMTIAPCLSYFESTNFRAFRNNTYLQRDKNFEGYVFYHDLNGNFVNGWQYVNGTAYAIQIQERDSEAMNFRSTDCSLQVSYTYTEWIQSGGYTGSLSEGTFEFILTSTAYTVYVYSLYCTEGGSGSGAYDPPPGGGGSNNNGQGGNSTTQPQTRDDCPPSAAANNTAANNILNSTFGEEAQVKSNIDKLKIFASTNPKEFSMTVDKNGNQFTVYDYSGGTGDPIYFQEGTNNSLTQSYNANTYLLAHTHSFTEGVINSMCPSPADAIAIASAYKGNPGSQGIVKALNIQASVIYGYDGSEYMIYVNNRDSLAAFCNNPSNSSFFEPTRPLFKAGSKFDTDYLIIWTNLGQQGYSTEDAQSYALSYVLDYYNTGLKIYKKVGSVFKEQKTYLQLVNPGATSQFTPKICQ